MRSSRPCLRIATCAVLTVLAQSAWSRHLLRFCVEASPSSLNPHIATDGPTLNVAGRTLYDALLGQEPGSEKMIPGLAERWEITPDGKTYTFHLRQGVKFHALGDFRPSRDLNADDVLFTFERMQSKDHPFYLVNGGNYPRYVAAGFQANMVSIKKRGPMTVVFVLKEPMSGFLPYLSTPNSAIHSAEYGDYLRKKGTPEKLDFEPVGTGPFQFKKFVRDSEVRLIAHDKYWRGRPKLDEIVTQIVPDSPVRAQKIRTGECDMISNPDTQDIASFRASPQLAITESEGANVGYLAFNTEKDPFRDVRVRQALAHALNRKAYVEAIYSGYGTEARSLLPSAFFSFPVGTLPEYDVEKARSLLAKAGFAKGLKVKLFALPIARHYNPNGRRMAELMQADLKKVGVEADIVTYDFATYLAKVKAGEHDLAQLGWGADRHDADMFLSPIVGCEGIRTKMNVARWCFKEFQSELDAAKRSISEKDQERHLSRALRLMAREVPLVPIAHGRQFGVTRIRVRNFKVPSASGFDFYPIEIVETEEAKAKSGR